MADNPHTVREHRDDFGFGRRHGLGNLVYVIPGAIALYFCVRYADGANAKLWIPLGVFIGCVAFGICFDWFRLRNYHCPSCGSAIRRPSLEQFGAGTPRRYYCPDCKIEWDTGLRIPED
jgi:hypothetical protein